MTRRLTQDAADAGDARQGWLAAVAADDRLTVEHHAAAEARSVVGDPAEEHAAAAEDLAKFGYLHVEEDGSYARTAPPRT